MKRPAELVDLARSRIRHATAVLGEVEIHGHGEMPLCWRPLLFMLAQATETLSLGSITRQQARLSQKGEVLRCGLMEIACERWKARVE